MAANCSSRAFHALAKIHEGRLGWLLGPTGWRNPRVPYALDNDAFSCWKNNLPFDADAWRKMLNKVPPSNPPLWALVPDVVADKAGTLKAWEKYSGEIASRGWPMGFAVQDGMVADDVPSEASVIFVGGTTQWKWSTVAYWCEHFPRVHIGRVNGIRRLWIAQRLGAESCDGTGYFRDTINGSSGRKLQAWLYHVTDPQYEFNGIKEPKEQQKELF